MSKKTLDPYFSKILFLEKVRGMFSRRENIAFAYLSNRFWGFGECVNSCTHLPKWHDLMKHIDRKRIDRKLDVTYLSKVPNISVQIS